MFSSDSTVENWKSALVQVQRLSEETRIRRVLVDVRKQTELADTTTLFNFGSNLPSSIAFAVLCELYLEDHHFIEDVAKNRGMTLNDFAFKQNAIAWLKNWSNKSIDTSKK